MLRELPYGELERVARARVADDLADIASSDVIDAKGRKRVTGMRASIEASASTTRDDLFYALLAKEYVLACRKAAPIATVAAKRYLAKRTIQNALTEARNRKTAYRPTRARQAGRRVDATGKEDLERRLHVSTAGSIKQAPNGTWTLAVDVPATNGSKRQQVRRRGFATKREAQAELTTILSGVQEGTFVKPSKLTFGQYLNTR